MKLLTQGRTVLTALSLIVALTLSLTASVQAADQNAPLFGSFHSAKDPDLPPLPFNPHPELSVVEVEKGVYVVDDTLIPDTPQEAAARVLRQEAAARAKAIASDPVLAQATHAAQQAAQEAAWTKNREHFEPSLQSGISLGDGRIETGADLEKVELQRLGEGIPALQEAEFVQRNAITNFALQNGVDIEGVSSDGSGMMLVRFVNGRPQSYISQNSVSAKTIATDKVKTNGGFGLSLTGQGLTIGLWDEGDVLTNHLEFGTNLWRVVDKDGVTGVRRHSTHVAGTLVAEGKDSGAVGMSPKASIDAYNFNDDLTEMRGAVTNGLRLSNHSYAYQRGWGTIDLGGFTYRMWWGDTNLSQNEDVGFGFYESTAQDIDRVHYLANSYLQVWAAGNERGPKGSPNATQPVGHWITPDGINLVWITTVTRALDGDAGGYDSLPNQMCAKNILAVGSVADLPNGYTNAASVVVSSFTSFGPTDDGRIKPDIAANGETLRSTVETGTSAYDNESGTSMASPSVAGSVNLLREHWFNLFGTNRQPWASTLKGLVIHTADEAGPTFGPDYQIGWGLMNTRRAALLISSNAAYATRQFIKEFSLINSNSVDYQVQATGTEPLKVTVCWTDPPGPIPPYMLDPTNRVLVNDLDLRVIAPNGTTNFPFVLNPAARTNAATTADNVRDNVEQVVITNATAGAYTIRVTYKGNLVNDVGTNSLQRFSLDASGVAPGTKPALLISSVAQTGAGQVRLQWAAVPGLNYQIQARNDSDSGTWSNVSPEINAYRVNPSYTLTGQTNANRFYRLVELP